MSAMLKLCEEFSKEYDVKFNSTKSALVTYNVNVDASFMLNNVPIVKADYAVHLGHIVGKDSNTKNISNGVSHLIGRANNILSKFNFCSSLVKSALFKTYCMSYYGCVLWSLRSHDINRIHVTWRKIIRRLWNVPYRTHCSLLPVLVDDHPIDTQLLIRFSKFILKAAHSDNQLISMSAKLSYFSNTSVAENIRFLAHTVNTDCVLRYSSYNNIKHRILNNQKICEDAKCVGICVRE